MPSLILLGNTNLATFANSIVAANEKAQALFGQPFDHVFAIHSDESFEKISHFSLPQTPEWIAHLNAHQIDHKLITHRIIPISAEHADVVPFVEYLNVVIRGLDETSSLIVDLTNSTTLYKNILSVAAHILDLRHQYFLDIQTLATLNNGLGYIGSEVLNRAYFPAPSSEKFDEIGYLGLTDVIRYRRKIDGQTDKYLKIGGQHADEEFFRRNLQHSIQLKLRNDQQNADSSLYRIATSSALASIDDLVRLILSKHENVEGLTFGQRLGRVENLLAQNAPDDFDITLIRKLNDLLLYLRNSTTHKSQYASHLERYKADLATQMLFSFSEIYTEIIAHTIDQMTESTPTRIRRLNPPDRSQEYYLGLDGDDTGIRIESEMLSAQSSDAVKRLSANISDAIAAIVRRIKSSDCSGKKAIIMNAGDNVLFFARPDMQLLEELQRIYTDKTNGMTCSIGYGKTLREAYLALKLAKTKPGKQGITGIELVP